MTPSGMESTTSVLRRSASTNCATACPIQWVLGAIPTRVNRHVSEPN
jgi:hypothetical protein